MQSKPQNIAKNTTWLTGAYIFQKIFAFVYFTLIARFLGATDIGSYVFAVSLATILSILIDFGLSPVLIRESSKNQDKANLYLNNIITVKIILAIITFIIAVITINLLNKGPMAEIMVYLAGLVMIFDSFTLSFWGIFRAWQNLKYEAISIAINQILIFTVGLIGVFLQLPLYILVIALLAGSIFNFIYSLTLLKTKLNFKIKLTWNKTVLKTLFIIALPFALAGIFTRVYNYIDQVLLSVLIGDQSLGWYSVAYKMTYALQFIPAAFAAAIFPAMSHLYKNDKDRLQYIFEKSMYFLIIMAIPTAFGVYILAEPVILYLYTTEYQASILTLQIFIFGIIGLFLNYPVGSLLNACDKQAINTANMGITMILNIILNIILIPQYQHLGAAIAALSSLSLLFILNLAWVPRIISYDYKYLISKTGLALFSATAMTITVYFLKPYLNFVLLIIVGAIIYLALMFLSRGFTKSDIKYLWQAMIKKQV